MLKNQWCGTRERTGDLELDLKDWVCISLCCLPVVHPVPNCFELWAQFSHWLPKFPVTAVINDHKFVRFMQINIFSHSCGDRDPKSSSCMGLDPLKAQNEIPFLPGPASGGGSRHPLACGYIAIISTSIVTRLFSLLLCLFLLCLL